MTRPGRIPCAVLGCRRTAPAEKFADTMICCGKCWRLGDKADRKAHADAMRLLRRHEGLDEAAALALPADVLTALAEAEETAHSTFQAIVETASQARAGIA